MVLLQLWPLLLLLVQKETRCRMQLLILHCLEYYQCLFIHILLTFIFESEPLFIGLFLGTSIHETSQVAAAGLIYDQQFSSPETLNIATVTKLIRNTFLIIMIPLFAFLYNRGKTTEKKYSIIDIFPYFVLGFVAMIIIRNLGDLMYSNNYKWLFTIEGIKLSSKIFLTMAMAAIGLSTNLKEIKNMGYKPFVVGFISMATVGLVCITTIELYLNYFN